MGDYILSPEVCVERKSLADLRQSFASGRLFHQAEAMCRHYAAPVLLIEFERDRAFALHAASELGSDPQARPCGGYMLYTLSSALSGVCAACGLRAGQRPAGAPMRGLHAFTHCPMPRLALLLTGTRRCVSAH